MKVASEVDPTGKALATTIGNRDSYRLRRIALVIFFTSEIRPRIITRFFDPNHGYFHLAPPR